MFTEKQLCSTLAVLWCVTKHSTTYIQYSMFWQTYLRWFLLTKTISLPLGHRAATSHIQGYNRVNAVFLCDHATGCESECDLCEAYSVTIDGYKIDLHTKLGASCCTTHEWGIRHKSDQELTWSRTEKLTLTDCPTKGSTKPKIFRLELYRSLTALPCTQLRSLSCVCMWL